MSFSVIYTTHPDKATAEKIANQLLEERLIACANIFPITSAFYWNDACQNDAEFVAIVKTRKKLVKKVESRIAELHPYDVPAILQWKVKANKAYEKWIKEETTPR
jgi:periplasmic divalent cation tolerance protein